MGRTNYPHEGIRKRYQHQSELRSSKHLPPPKRLGISPGERDESDKKLMRGSIIFVLIVSLIVFLSEVLK